MSDIWYCWECDQGWDRTRKKTKQCPDCRRMGVAAETL